MKQKILRAGDAYLYEEECRKRLRLARECAKAHSFYIKYSELWKKRGRDSNENST